MFDPTTFVGFHTWLSLIAIVAGFPVTVGLLHGHTRPGWTGIFLSTAFATSATGFGFPFNGVLPSHVVGAIHIVLVAIAAYALYGRRLEDGWRRIYAIMAVLSFYLLIFVLVAQLFSKVRSAVLGVGRPKFIEVLCQHFDGDLKSLAGTLQD